MSLVGPVARKWIIGIFVVGLLVVYGSFDPSTQTFFPRCPFLSLTGYKCPGCGSQRAIHAILHGELGAAWSFNPLLLLSIPYMLAGALLDMNKEPTPMALQLRRRFYGTPAILVVLIVVVGFWILRNIP